MKRKEILFWFQWYSFIFFSSIATATWPLSHSLLLKCFYKQVFYSSIFFHRKIAYNCIQYKYRFLLEENPFNNLTHTTVLTCSTLYNAMYMYSVQCTLRNTRRHCLLQDETMKQQNECLSSFVLFVARSPLWFCFIVNYHNRNKNSHYRRKKIEKHFTRHFSSP